MKAFTDREWFPAITFIVLHKAVLRFKSMYEIIKAIQADNHILPYQRNYDIGQML